ncbi:glycosyltransferase family 4 protein [Microtetraspora malaysiensis]|uniref:Glycosyltransferase family 4 protein n=1 Tax=Microtetraspora malaysiensis TaxID=161358 RepID=A0ABW6SKK0_9ACTN
MNIVFVLLTYSEDAPAGLERSTAALIEGLRQLGHRVTVLTTTERATGDGLVGLASVRVPNVAVEEDLMEALANPEPVCREVRNLLAEYKVDVVCWADASWGLGYLAPAPAGVRTVLKLAVLRTDPMFARALAQRPDVVMTNSDFLISQASDAGFDTRSWAAVPNALLTAAVPPSPDRREQLRQRGPIRIVARAEPHKGIAELIEAIPEDLARPVEIVLAAAGFEYWPGMQEEVITACRRAALAAPSEVRLLPAMPWQQVPEFFAAAAATIISTTSPETWCNAAAEALSAGTPVVGYNFGHVPVLAGSAGRMVAPGLPASALWQATLDLLADPDSYHAASVQAVAQVAGHTPAASARAFLAAVTPPASA